MRDLGPVAELLIARQAAIIPPPPEGGRLLHLRAILNDDRVTLEL
jgi:hypothetical protein